MATASDEQPIRDEPAFVSAWLEAIEDASKEEKEWRGEAKEAVDAYRGKSPESKKFNLYHANIETIVPALYNSVPSPDVRRRFLDPNPAAKVVADIIERAISYSIDAYDFDAAMLACVRDMAIVGRGVERVRYNVTEDDQGLVIDEQTTCEYVPWRSFRRGPGRLWSDVTWIAFQHFLDKATIASRVEPDVLKEIPFTHSAAAKDEDSTSKDNTAGPPRFGKRAEVWEVWDKEKREVHFICPDYSEARLWTVPDPLGLIEFFPIPRPMQAVTTTDTLVPVSSYTLYKSLLQDLDKVSRRIAALVEQLRPRGIYVDVGGTDMKVWAEADDGELVPMQGVEMFMQSGGSIEKAIAWFPLEPIILALRELVQHREMIKQNIYEVTKIADVMRGVSKPNETLGAQNLKAEWGSLAIQRMQAEIARFARDLFRLKAEVMVDKMEFPHLLQITGIKLPTQQEKDTAKQQYEAAQAQAQQPPADGAPPTQPPPEPSPEIMAYYTGPSVEEVEQLFKSDAMRGYHIDIESDSTVRADLGRKQEQMGQFLQGVSGFGAAMGPMVETGAMPMEVAIEIFAAFARSYKLGKQAEDALDQWADQAKNKGKQQQGPDPAQAQADAQAQAEQAKIAADKETAQAKMQADMQAKQAELQARSQENQERLAFEREKTGGEFQFKAKELELKERDLALKTAAQNKMLVDEATQTALEGQEGTPDEARGPTPLEQTLQQMAQLAQVFAQGIAALAQGQQQLAQGQQQMAQGQAQQTAALIAMARASAAPKRLVRDDGGRAVGVETVAVN
jgi:hypothetical protein